MWLKFVFQFRIKMKYVSVHCLCVILLDQKEQTELKLMEID